MGVTGRRVAPAKRIGVAGETIRRDLIELGDAGLINRTYGGATISLVTSEPVISERGLTMVLVTHDSTVARRTQRIGVMKNGRLSFRQPARDLTAERLQPPDLEAADSVPADE